MEPTVNPQGQISSVSGEKVAAVVNPTIAGDFVVSMSSPGATIRVHKPPRNLPERQTFVGRASELRELHELLCREPIVGVTQQAAVHGHGGVGKSSLAIEYGWRRLNDYPGGVFFLSCEDSAGAPPVETLAPHLGLASSPTAAETAARVKAHLETSEPSLLILDNVRGAEQVRDRTWSSALPGGACRRLVTTRAEHLPNVPLYPLGRLLPADGLALLAEYRPDVRQSAEVGRSIVEWFDGLAVGLAVVGAYMQMNSGLSWDDYRRSLGAKGLGAVRLTEDAVADVRTYASRVAAVFDDLVDSLPVAERRVLEYAALLPEDNVYLPWLPRLLVSDGVPLPEPPGYEGRGAEHTVQVLIHRSLLRPLSADGSLLSLHRVLRLRVRERLEESADVTALLGAVVTLARERAAESKSAVWDKALRGELAPLAALSLDLADAGDLDSATELALNVSPPLRALGRFAEARKVLERLVAMEEAASGDAPSSGALLNNFSLLLQDLGELTEARRWMERAIEIVEKQVEADLPALATSYSNLATILQDLGELAEARRRMERAIEIDEEHFDADHPTLATRYSNLAVILKDLGELAEARRWMERAVEIQEKHFDADHPTLAISYNNLAYIEAESGHSAEACRLFRRAEAILKKHFGASHPHVQAVEASIRGICGSDRRRN
jgi:tetratricopeptide (TPR) repeat protein